MTNIVKTISSRKSLEWILGSVMRSVENLIIESK